MKSHKKQHPQFQWDLPSSFQGYEPYERSGHSMVVGPNQTLFIYGGKDVNENLLSDLVICDLKTQEWKIASINRQLESKTKKQLNFHPSQEFFHSPHPRANHTAITFEDWMVVFGGNPNEDRGEVFLLHMDSITWTKVVLSNLPAEAKIPRSFHSASLWKNYMVVFGGIHFSTPIQGILLFDLKKFKWIFHPCSVQPVYGHDSFVKNDYLYIVGGTNTNGKIIIINLNDFSSVKLMHFLENLLIPRTGLAVAYDDVNDLVFIFGGYNASIENTCSSQVELIDLQSNEVIILDSSVSSPSPFPICGHSAVALNGVFYVFGGCNRLPLMNGEWIFCEYSNTLWTFRNKGTPFSSYTPTGSDPSVQYH